MALVLIMVIQVSLPQVAGYTPSKRNPALYGVKFGPAPGEGAEDGADPDEEADPAEAVLPSTIFASAIIDYREPIAVLSLIGSALIKMLKVPICSYDHPLDSIDKRHTICFKKNGKKSDVFWSTDLKRVKKFHMDYVATARAVYYHAVEDLGRGMSGRVWLVVTSSGRTCVGKLPSTSKNDKEWEVRIPICTRPDVVVSSRTCRFFIRKALVHKEARQWHEIYPEFKSGVKVETWSGRLALRMPHFGAIPFEDRHSHIDAVAKVLTTKFHATGRKHMDVKWKNIGRYRTEDGGMEVVVYDLGLVERLADGEDKTWIQTALKDLSTRSKDG